MKLNKIQIASILLGFATVASAQTSPFSSVAGGDGQSRIQVAQAGNNQTGPGASGQGNQGAPGMGQGGGQQQRKGPPPQAIEACKGKSSGAVCSFTGRNNQTVNGSCFAPPPAGGQTSAPNSSGASGAQGNHPPACRPQQGGQQGGANKAPGG